MTDNKLSISVFFPCYNDAGTIATMVVLAFKALREVCSDYEVIVVDDGSSDASIDILNELKAQYNDRFRVIAHKENKGYGGALRTGISNASKAMVFYTDGDAQYDVRDLKKMVPLMKAGVDIVNGFKINRCDPFCRVLIGRFYNRLVKIMFGLKIKDVDCDFRLMRKSMLEKIELEYYSGVICVEMIKKLQDRGAVFAETGVSHYFRAYGKSQFFNFRRIFGAGIDILKLWWQLVILKRY